MKAIFLDIDGVVATPLSVRLSYRLHLDMEHQVYDPRSMFYLGQLVRRTGAVVVLASNWRTAILSDIPQEKEIMENLLRQLRRFGAPISGVTPLLAEGDRSAEIGAWLDEHPCESWVIFDDLASFETRPEVVGERLVLIDDSEGIRREHYRRAREILR